tara:strand:+ start:245 stop:460 length:216 start_codon:yes stop_codon:yes gene_type:complete
VAPFAFVEMIVVPPEEDAHLSSPVEASSMESDWPADPIAEGILSEYEVLLIVETGPAILTLPVSPATDDSS